ncbi:MAG: anti-sigma-K factor RskA [Acidimicrobiales bacterium]|jgi:anti-sigma-K factor RskA
MTASHQQFSGWAAAYALGALDPNDRRAFERHTAECSICATDLKAVAPVPGLLASIDRSELDDLSDSTTAAAIASRVLGEEHQLLASRKRWRLATLSGAAAVLLILGSVLAVADETGLEEARAPSVDVVPAIVVLSRAEAAAVLTQPRGWGTEIQLDLAGLPPRGEYQLWAVDRDGAWSIASTWGPTPTGGAKITGATSLTSETLERIVITSQDREDILVDASV